MKRLLARGWFCPVLLLVLAAILILLVDWRTALVSTVLLAGPIVLAWMILAGPLSRREIERGPEKRAKWREIGGRP